MRQHSKLFAIALASAAILGGSGAEMAPAQTRNSGNSLSVKPMTYADVADIALAAPIAAHVRIRKASRIKGEQAATALPGRRRFLVEADVTALIRSNGQVPARITYLVDIAPNALGKFPKLPKSDQVILAQPVAQMAGTVRLVSPDAQLPLTPDAGMRVRPLLVEAQAAGAAPRIRAIREAFHTAGTVAGEGETQIFMEAENGQPLSLSILRVSGQAPAWSVALGDVVDEGAGPPQRDTLLWYRLACHLPARLPDAATANLDESDAQATQADYRVVMDGLGRCDRTPKGY